MTSFFLSIQKHFSLTKKRPGLVNIINSVTILYQACLSNAFQTDITVNNKTSYTKNYWFHCRRSIKKKFFYKKITL